MSNINLSKIPAMSKNKPAKIQNKQTTDSVPANFQAFQAQLYSGPLPPPRVLEEYERIMSGATDRIFKVFEAQSEHRHKMESAVISSNIELARRGQNYALFISFVVISFGFALIFFGKDLAGLVSIVTPLASLAAVFITSKVVQKKELKTKHEQLQSHK